MNSNPRRKSIEDDSIFFELVKSRIQKSRSLHSNGQVTQKRPLEKIKQHSVDRVDTETNAGEDMQEILSTRLIEK